MAKYRGKYPQNINSVWTRRGVCCVKTNNGQTWQILHFKKSAIKLPTPGEDLQDYCTKTGGELRVASVTD